ncbi:hypothetical protein [Paracidovorax konjaci]|uniref:Uncharacterized protein n=1 Tax=Paracidovorax konjaci TaxID=32040 RepID=A0A1I1V7P7_9BURK|nr:hypothetical protein [Paracidovorax konjaci]SFD78018.1 hypothetical protein SAMN04489710_10649 [Paracidovorax konjaci]
MSMLSDISMARAGSDRRVRGARPLVGAPRRAPRLPLPLAAALRRASPMVRFGPTARPAPAGNADVCDGLAPSPARQLMDRFQFSELDAMQRSQMRQVVEFLGGRGKALRTAPLRPTGRLCAPPSAKRSCAR